eukprot:Phypoly_transcript_18863.p2 GENE.Phypoly_transcript_18863~~Phypoly_transcript_18863.p2  ORF type:complete len:111 (-),score=16.98 Phypoly_transcript_18863:83-415(-)
MSVNFGAQPAGTDPASVLASFVAYAGAYAIDATTPDIVHHYPQISSNVNVPVGSDIVRHFVFLESMCERRRRRKKKRGGEREREEQIGFFESLDTDANIFFRREPFQPYH